MYDNLYQTQMKNNKYPELKKFPFSSLQQVTIYTYDKFLSSVLMKQQIWWMSATKFWEHLLGNDNANGTQWLHIQDQQLYVYLAAHEAIHYVWKKCWHIKS